jgi:hypothetical protein
MKKRMEGQHKRVIPAFATEAEEAEWWYRNRNIHGKRLLAAVKSGEAQVLTKEKLPERIAASKKTPAPVVALRIPPARLRARDPHAPASSGGSGSRRL